MTHNSMIVETKATGAEIEQLIGKLVTQLNGVEKSKAVMACLTLVMLIQKEDITAEEIQYNVREISQFICMLLDTPAEGIKAN